MSPLTRTPLHAGVNTVFTLGDDGEVDSWSDNVKKANDSAVHGVRATTTQPTTTATTTTATAATSACSSNSPTCVLHTQLSQLLPTLCSPALCIALLALQQASSLPSTRSSFSLPASPTDSSCLSPSLHSTSLDQLYDSSLQHTLLQHLHTFIQLMQPLLRLAHSKSRRTRQKNKRKSKSSAKAPPSISEGDENATEEQSHAAAALFTALSSPISTLSRSIRQCYEHFTPTTLAVLPFLLNYYTVMQQLLVARYIGFTLHSSVTASLNAAGLATLLQHKFTPDLCSTLSSLTPTLSSAATTVPAVPDFSAQLQSAVAQRMNGSANEPALSLATLCFLQPAATLQSLQALLGLKHLQSSSDSGNSSSQSATGSSAASTGTNLLLLNEETKLRKDLALYGDGSLFGSFTGSLHRSDQLPYFELCIRLYDRVAPHLLVAFVKKVDDMFPSSRSAAVNADEAAVTNGSVAPSSSVPLLSQRSILPSVAQHESPLDRALRILPPLQSYSGQVTDTASATPLHVLQQQRIAARCELYVLCGRLIDAVLLRLSIAEQRNDMSQEEAAIQLAYSIIYPQTSLAGQPQSLAAAASAPTAFRTTLSKSHSESSSLAAVAASSVASPKLPLLLSQRSTPSPASPVPTHARLPATASSSLSSAHMYHPHAYPHPADVHASSIISLRAALFHHFLCYWIRKQLRLRMSSRAADTDGSLFSPTSLLSCYHDLDARVIALQSPHFSVHTFLHIVTQQLQQIRKKLDGGATSQSASVATSHNNTAVHTPSASPVSISPNLSQHAIAPQSRAASLPCPFVLPHQSAIAATNGVSVSSAHELQIGSLLPQLRRFASDMRT